MGQIARYLYYWLTRGMQMAFAQVKAADKFPSSTEAERDDSGRKAQGAIDGGRRLQFAASGDRVMDVCDSCFPPGGQYVVDARVLYQSESGNSQWAGYYWYGPGVATKEEIASWIAEQPPEAETDSAKKIRRWKEEKVQTNVEYVGVWSELLTG